MTPSKKEFSIYKVSLIVVLCAIAQLSHAQKKYPTTDIEPYSLSSFVVSEIAL